MYSKYESAQMVLQNIRKMKKKKEKKKNYKSGKDIAQEETKNRRIKQLELNSFLEGFMPWMKWFKKK